MMTLTPLQMKRHNATVSQAVIHRYHSQGKTIGPIVRDSHTNATITAETMDDDSKKENLDQLWIETEAGMKNTDHRADERISDEDEDVNKARDRMVLGHLGERNKRFCMENVVMYVTKRDIWQEDVDY